MKARICVALMLCAPVVSLRADSVLMQNGDRYNGKVLSVTATNLVFQSEVLGPVSLPRSKVAHVAFETNVVVNPPAVPSSTKSNLAAEISPTLRQLAAHTNLIQQVQERFLSSASPEASAKFSEMLKDLTSGKMTIADLRAQAKDAAEQLRALQRESGESGSSAADLYLSILDRFLGDTNTLEKPKTNSTSPR